MAVDNGRVRLSISYFISYQDLFLEGKLPLQVERKGEIFNYYARSIRQKSIINCTLFSNLHVYAKI